MLKPGQRDLYADALRAGALLVVVLAHWLATRPQLEDGRLLATGHLLGQWPPADALTWLVQVVPVFVFVSGAVSVPGVLARLAGRQQQRHWWAGRALALARPAVTYLALLAALALVAQVTGGRLLAAFNQSLTIHLWFLPMLLAVQALLPWAVRADRRFGLRAVAALVLLAALADLIRAGITSPAQLAQLGARVSAAPPGIGWLNLLVVWLIPQQLGIAWQQSRLAGARAGAGLLALAVVWLVLATSSGYPVAMVGVTLAGNNMLPPSLALIGVIWLQVALVLLCERPARRFLARHQATRVIAIAAALGMPLYLWHKLAELPAAWLAESLLRVLERGAQSASDAGVIAAIAGGLAAALAAPGPEAPGFWLGRVLWLVLCALMVAPVLAAVVGFERSRRPRREPADALLPVLAGAVALFAGLIVAMALGVMPGGLIGLVGVVAASWLLRAHPQPR
ncbi:MAG: acyltransferase family protein [Lysobacterales bacterium]